MKIILGCLAVLLLAGPASAASSESDERESTPPSRAAAAKAKPRPDAPRHGHSPAAARKPHDAAPKKPPRQTRAAALRARADDKDDKNGKDDKDDDIETENLFGFTVGSDTERAGAKGAALETVARFGKREGQYGAIGKKLEFGYGITDDLSASLGLLGSYHHVASVPGLEDVRSGGFNGVGAELRWRLLRRGPSSFGMTLHLEPGWQTHDELTGLRATKLGSENKLIFDTELVKDRVFAAFNLLYDFERVREKGDADWEHSSQIGLAVAAAVAVAPKVFLGFEARYLRAYEGLLPETFVGNAVYVGPTLFAQFAPNAWIAAAWNIQVAGRETGTAGRLDLTNFERHQARLKIGVEF